jgi:predicted PurR-regulated permease PerM
MARIGTSKPSANALLSGTALIALLYFGREILLPFALSILLSFVLVPTVERLEKWRIRRIPAVLSVVTFAFIAVAIVATILAHQVYDLAYDLPNYKGNIIAKAQAFQTDQDGVWKRASDALEDVRLRLTRRHEQVSLGDGASSHEASSSDEISVLKPNSHQRTLEPDSGNTPEPIPVEIVTGLSGSDILQTILGPLVAPITSSAMILVFVIFMLLEREDLRNRFIQLVGAGQLNTTTKAIDDAASRVGRYLRMQLIVNSVYGLVIAIGLFAIGLPSAFLWGALAAALRFVPFVGAAISAALPIAISLAVFDGWTRPSLVVALFVANELVSNNVLEPWLYGSSTGISTIGILASTVFWAWLWGPVGLVMATPLTVCLTVVGRYVPQLSFLNTLVSESSGLSPSARLYQRLLAMDPDEAIEVADEYLESSSLEDLYDKVILPALHLAELDRHHGDLDETREKFILQTLREIIEELGTRAAVKAESDEPNASSLGENDSSAPVLCLPARDEADELVAMMLVQLLERKKISAQVRSTAVLSGEIIDQIASESVRIVCISALPPLAVSHARYLCKRIKLKAPSVTIVVGQWQSTGTTIKSQQRLLEAGMNKRVLTLVDAINELELLSNAQPEVETPKELEYGR